LLTHPNMITMTAEEHIPNASTFLRLNLSPKIPLMYKPLRKKRINYVSSHIHYIMENTTDN